jgi:hypothetical protein
LDPTPTEQRKMFIAADEDFTKKFKPETAEEVVYNFLAKRGPSPSLAQAGPSSPDYGDFDWLDDPSVVLRSQPATAIYRNDAGHLVIRQERSWAQEEDPYVMISPENAVTFMEALAKKARE